MEQIDICKILTHWDVLLVQYYLRSWESVRVSWFNTYAFPNDVSWLLTTILFHFITCTLYYTSCHLCRKCIYHSFISSLHILPYDRHDWVVSLFFLFLSLCCQNGCLLDFSCRQVHILSFVSAMYNCIISYCFSFCLNMWWTIVSSKMTL